MKVKILFLLFLVFSFSFTLTQAALSYTAPNIEVTLQSQSPDPVEPGQVVKVKFKIENSGAESKVDNLVKILPKFPFTLYGDVAEKNLGKLRASQTGADAAIVEFNLKVEEAAVEGDTEIELMVKTAPESWAAYTNNELLIDIQTQDAVLEISKVTSEPEQIPVGGTATINILVKNLADSLLKDIKFKLELDSSSLPLAPYQSSSERRIAQLQTNQQKALTFQLIAEPEAEAGLYKIPLNITYNDEKGKAYRVKDILAVTVGGKPLVKPYFKKSTSLQANKPATLTLEIANPSPVNVKFLEVYLLPSPDYQLISTSDYFYIGDLDSDDTESEEITIFINKNVETLNLPVRLKYSDANNQPYQQQFNLELKLYSSSRLRKFGLLSQSYTRFILGILLLGGGLLYLYRKRKKK